MGGSRSEGAAARIWRCTGVVDVGTGLVTENAAGEASKCAVTRALGEVRCVWNVTLEFNFLAHITIFSGYITMDTRSGGILANYCISLW